MEYYLKYGLYMIEKAGLLVGFFVGAYSGKGIDF
jgi:hypothetical protein